MRKFFFWSVGAASFLLFAFVIYLLASPKNVQRGRVQNAGVKQPLSVDEVVDHIAQYRGFVGVQGRVLQIAEDSSFFMLGSEETDRKLPITCRSPIPTEGASIIAYGRIRMDEGERYILEASVIKAK